MSPAPAVSQAFILYCRAGVVTGTLIRGSSQALTPTQRILPVPLSLPCCPQCHSLLWGCQHPFAKKSKTLSLKLSHSDTLSPECTFSTEATTPFSPDMAQCHPSPTTRAHSP